MAGNTTVFLWINDVCGSAGRALAKLAWLDDSDICAS